MVDASRQDDAFGASAAATYPRCRDGRSRVRGFTILELLVVMLILTILISTVVVVGTTVIQKGKVNNTKAVLQVVADALEEFKREQQTHRTITKRKAYRNRYGDYPPDELEVFTPLGLPGSVPPPANRSLAVGRAPIVPTPGPTAWPDMRFYANGDPLKDSLEHRDLAAMIVAIETMSEKAALILGRLPKRNRTSGPIDPATGEPSLWLDRDGDGLWTSNEDFQIRYITDAWGVPLSYLAQRDWKANDPPPLQLLKTSTNHPDWSEASTEIIRINRGQPLIFSYGPDGKDQLTKDWMVVASNVPGVASLVGDFEGTAPHGQIDHHLNADNVYLDPDLSVRLARETEE